jgi:hypothetical protein
MPGLSGATASHQEMVSALRISGASNRHSSELASNIIGRAAESE